jgi:hypothetical protein
MKKTMFFIIFITIAIKIFSITPVKLDNFGIIGNLNSNHTNVCNSSVYGYGIGVFYEASVKGIYLCPSLQISKKNSNIGRYLNYQKSNTLSFPNETFNTTYLDLSILLKYKYNVNNNVKLLISAGPIYSDGISATITSNDKTKTDNLYNQEGCILSKYDIGLNLNIGIELYNHYQVSIGYTKGTKDLYNNDWYPVTKNETILLSIAYIL